MNEQKESDASDSHANRNGNVDESPPPLAAAPAPPPPPSVTNDTKPLTERIESVTPMNSQLEAAAALETAEHQQDDQNADKMKEQASKPQLLSDPAESPTPGNDDDDDDHDDDHQCKQSTPATKQKDTYAIKNESNEKYVDKESLAKGDDQIPKNKTNSFSTQKKEDHDSWQTKSLSPPDRVYDAKQEEQELPKQADLQLASPNHGNAQKNEYSKEQMAGVSTQEERKYEKMAGLQLAAPTSTNSNLQLNSTNDQQQLETDTNNTTASASTTASGQPSRQQEEVRPGATHVVFGERSVRVKGVLTSHPRIPSNETPTIPPPIPPTPPTPSIATTDDNNNNMVMTSPNSPSSPPLPPTQPEDTEEVRTNSQTIPSDVETANVQSNPQPAPTLKQRALCWKILIPVVLVVFVLAVVTPIVVKRRSDSGDMNDDVLNNTQQRQQALEEYILDSNISSIDSLNDPLSVQSQALEWIVTLDKLTLFDLDNVDTSDQINYDKIVSRYVLVVFYYTLNGPSWLSATKWLNGDADECDWQYVSCQNGYIVGLDTSSLASSRNRYLQGVLPSELYYLNNLLRINFKSNRIEGFTDLPTSLEYLDLRDNSISTIPDGVFRSMTNLETLRLSENNIIISVLRASSIFDVPTLLHLDLAQNDLRGDISMDLQYLSNLVTLDLSDNELTGQIDDYIAHRSDLVTLSLDKNKLTGLISANIGTLSNLEHLNVGFNDLNGTIPTEIGKLTVLNNFQIEGNAQISGSLPFEIGVMTSLENFSMGFHENVFGRLPSSIGYLTNMVNFFVLTVDLTGSLPTELGLMKSIEQLMITNTQISGRIPSELGFLSNSLLSLRLEGNDLSGEIPLEMENLSNLGILGLERNAGFEGSLSDGICALPGLSMVSISCPPLMCPESCSGICGCV